MLWWWIVSTGSLLVNNSAYAVRYPNEVVDTPLVTCEPDRITIKIRTSTANPSTIYAEDFHHSPNCLVRSENTIVIRHGECGMTTEQMDNPSGIMYRICIAVQIHPLFVTDSDRSYCAQCVYMDNSVVDNLEQNIAISEIAPSELEPQFDETSSPQCTYSIRKGSFNGPEVHAAVVGETVFHFWSCSNANLGILVQNCHVEDLQGNKILIIDNNGCGVDQYLFKTPTYSEDLQTAFLESSVFKFVDKSMTRFRCQIRLCVKNRGHGCEQVTPPTSCPNFDESEAPFPNGVEDISDKPKTVGNALDPVPLTAPPVSAAAAPIHQRRHTTTSTTGPPSVRPYGLSSAHAISHNHQNSQLNQQQAARNFDEERQKTRQRRSTFLTGTGSLLLNRPRRAISIGPETSNSELPELDVVGLIRVLDNPEDLDYFDNQRNKQSQANSGEEGDKKKCLPLRLYWSLIGAVFLAFGALFAASTFVVLQRMLIGRNQVYAKKWMR